MIFREPFLRDRVALITGGGTGIGLVTARVLAQLGAKLVLTGRREEVLAQAEAALRAELGPDLEVLSCVSNVREPEAVEACLDAALERFGQVDVLINNAGANFVCPSERLSPKGWRSVMATIADGTFYCSRFVGAHMVARSQGSIVSIVTPYADLGAPGLAPSCAGKAAVIALTRTLAVEWAGAGVRVNAVSPGAVDTEGSAARLWSSEAVKAKVIADIPLGRMARPEEVAHAIAFLVSPYAGFITGAILPLDGGQNLGRGILGLL